MTSGQESAKIFARPTRWMNTCRPLTDEDESGIPTGFWDYERHSPPAQASLAASTEDLEMTTTIYLDSPLTVIRKKCLDCTNGSSGEIKMCLLPECPNWLYRFGKRPSTVLSSRNACWLEPNYVLDQNIESLCRDGIPESDAKKMVRIPDVEIKLESRPSDPTKAGNPAALLAYNKSKSQTADSLNVDAEPVRPALGPRA